MKPFHRVLRAGAIVFSLVMCLSLPGFADNGDAPIDDAVQALPIFVTHVHYKEPAWETYPPATVLELFDKSGVAMALVSSTPDAGTTKLWRFAPRRVVPALRPYYGDIGSSNWTTVEGMFEYIVGRLDAYPHEGIGDFHLHSVDTDD